MAKKARKARLSTTRLNWVEARSHDHTFKGKPLHPPTAVERRFQAALQRMIDRMQRATVYQLERLFASPLAAENGMYMAMDQSFTAAASRVMRELTKRFTALFVDRAGGLAEAWIKGIERHSVVGLGQSLKEASGGVTLKTDFISGEVADVLRASVKSNVALIKSIPEKYFLEIEDAVMRSIQSEQGMAYLKPFLERRYGITSRRADLIARDQTSKATTALNRARLKKLNVKKFEWLHSGGSNEPRHLHKYVLDGEIFELDNPPVIDERTGERGLPGQLINCKCTMVPVLEFIAEEIE